MGNIYIVEGNTGEYSDRQNWFFGAFTTFAAATEAKNTLNAALKELGLGYDVRSNYATREKNSALFIKNYDDQFVCDYTGTEYVIHEVRLF